MSRRDIVNNAILFLGKERIVSLEDNRPEVHAALDLLNQAIDHCLSDDLWAIAVKFLELVPSADQSLGRPGYIRFELPANFLNVRGIWYGAGGNHDEIKGRFQDGFYSDKVEDYAVRENDLLVRGRDVSYSNKSCPPDVDETCEETSSHEDLVLEYSYRKRDQFSGQFTLYCGYVLADLLAESFAPSADYSERIRQKAMQTRLRVASQQVNLKSARRRSLLWNSRW